MMPEILFASLSFVLCYLVVGLNGKLLISILQKIGFTQFIRKEGPASHQSKQSTPTAGGISFGLILLIVPTLIFILEKFLESKQINWSIILVTALTLLGSGAIGFWDDYLKKVKKENEGLKPKQKLVAQILLSVFLAFYLGRTNSNFFGLNIDFQNFALFAFFVFLVLSGTMNAANLTDGLDGLASSVLGMCYLGLGSLLWLTKTNSLESLAWSFGLAGICFGFLLINGHPAKAFMGDTGSFFLGGGLAALALINRLEWYLLFLAIIPIFETLSVIIQVLSVKISKKFFKRDWRPFKMSPFHHHLELCGWKEKKIVFVLSFLQALINAVFLLFSYLKK